MNEFRAILNEGLNHIAREKKVSDIFAPKVKEYLETLGYDNMKYVSLTENICDESRWHVLIHDVFTPYSYFPDSNKLVLNTDLDNTSHKERYKQLLGNVLGNPDSSILASLYLISVDGNLFEFCHNFVFDDGIDFKNLQQNPCIDLLNVDQRLFIDTAESLCTKNSTFSVQPNRIISMKKEKIRQFCNGILIASGEKLGDVDDSFSIETKTEVI